MTDPIRKYGRNTRPKIQEVLIDIEPFNSTILNDPIDPKLLIAVKRPIVVIEPIPEHLLSLAKETKSLEAEIPKKLQATKMNTSNDLQLHRSYSVERAGSFQSASTSFTIFTDYSDDVPSEFSFDDETPPTTSYCKVTIGHRHPDEWPKIRVPPRVSKSQRRRTTKAPKPRRPVDWDDGSVQHWFFVDRK